MEWDEELASTDYDSANQSPLDRSIMTFIDFCDTHHHGRGDSEQYEGCPIPPKTFRTPSGHRRVNARELMTFVEEIKAALPGLRERVAMLKAANDPESVWERRLDALCASGLSRQKAVLSLVRSDPQLHEDYVRSINGGGQLVHRLT